MQLLLALLPVAATRVLKKQSHHKLLLQLTQQAAAVWCQSLAGF